MTIFVINPQHPQLPAQGLNKIDPMKIQLWKEEVLKGSQLFPAELMASDRF